MFCCWLFGPICYWGSVVLSLGQPQLQVSSYPLICVFPTPVPNSSPALISTNSCFSRPWILRESSTPLLSPAPGQKITPTHLFSLPLPSILLPSRLTRILWDSPKCHNFKKYIKKAAHICVTSINPRFWSITCVSSSTDQNAQLLAHWGCIFRLFSTGPTLSF